MLAATDAPLVRQSRRREVKAGYCHPLNCEPLLFYLSSLENYYYPRQFDGAIKQWVEHYNNHRCHESINNVTPANVFFGRGQQILSRREQIKQSTLIQRKVENLKTGVV